MLVAIVRRIGKLSLDKRSQLFSHMHNEPLSLVPMNVCNPDCSPFGNTHKFAGDTPVTTVKELLGRLAQW